MTLYQHNRIIHAFQLFLYASVPDSMKNEKCKYARAARK